MSTWKAHVQLRCIAGPVMFSVNDATYAMSGHDAAHFNALVARYLNEVASAHDDPFGKGVTWVSGGYMQIRGRGVYASGTISMEVTR